MSTYDPAYDPAVHGPVYAARHPGQVTRPFPAVTTPLLARQGQYEQPCPYGCPVHPPMPLGESRALLYAGPGITDRTWQARVREGAWDDIPAEFDAIHARVHLPAIKGNRNIRRDVSDGRHHLAAAFSANPDWRTDQGLAEGLHAAEAALAAQLIEMERASSERWAPRDVAA